jgi:hypothetical protein
MNNLSNKWAALVLAIIAVWFILIVAVVLSTQVAHAKPVPPSSWSITVSGGSSYEPPASVGY